MLAAVAPSLRPTPIFEDRHLLAPLSFFLPSLLKPSSDRPVGGGREGGRERGPLLAVRPSVRSSLPRSLPPHLGALSRSLALSLPSFGLCCLVAAHWCVRTALEERKEGREREGREKIEDAQTRKSCTHDDEQERRGERERLSAGGGKKGGSS